MPSTPLADAVVLLHLSFILFVLFGAFLVLRYPRIAYLHVPAAIWAILLEVFGWTCPLTPLENTLRERAGADAYAGGFIEHYVLPVLYPADLTRELQLYAGLGVFVLNLAIYWYVLRR
jgi:hypothetical protein